MATYTPSSGDKIAPGSTAATELASPVGGFIAGCGQAALAVILNAQRGTGTSWQEVTNLIQASVNAHKTVGVLAKSGQSSPATLNYLAGQNGVQLTSMNYQQALGSYAGSRQVILGVNNATAFGGSDANVRGHYITVVGVTPTGNYIVSDPNTPASRNGQFVTYTPQQIMAAQPFWAAVSSSAPSGSSAAGGRFAMPPPAPGGNTCGPMPPVTDVANYAAWVLCMASQGGQSSANNPLSSIATSLAGIGGGIAAITAWVSNPWRIAKFLLGILLIIGALLIAFLGDIAAGVAVATGNPELAGVGRALGRGKPGGAVRAGIGAAATRAGTQPIATREVRVQRAAEAAAIQQEGRARNVAWQKYYAEQARRAAFAAQPTHPLRNPNTMTGGKAPKTPPGGPNNAPRAGAFRSARQRAANAARGFEPPTQGAGFTMRPVEHEHYDDEETPQPAPTTTPATPQPATPQPATTPPAASIFSGAGAELAKGGRTPPKPALTPDEQAALRKETDAALALAHQRIAAFDQEQASEPVRAARSPQRAKGSSVRAGPRSPGMRRVIRLLAHQQAEARNTAALQKPKPKAILPKRKRKTS